MSLQAQKYNPDLEALQASIFQRRTGESQFAWQKISSMFTNLPACRGFWPLSVNEWDGAISYATDVATGYDFTLVGDPPFCVGTTFLAHYMRFDGATQYLNIADQPQHDILGTEVYVDAPIRGLTIAGWFKVHTYPAPGGQRGLFTKFTTGGNLRAYGLFQANTVLTFNVSSLGTAASEVWVGSGITPTIDVWHWVCGRFLPSKEINIWVDDTEWTNVVATPASIFNSSAPLEAAAYNVGAAANLMEGSASLLGLWASYLSDEQCRLLRWHSRDYFGV